MAETFKVGANARELLRYTQRATRIVTDDISRSDARKIIQKVAALEDVRDIQKVCGTAVHALDTRDREGFSKSTFRLYGEGIRLTARLLKEGRLVICKGCDDAVREFSLYRWEDSGERDQPKKEHDHAMDEIRYFAATVAGRTAGTSPVCAGSVERRAQ